MGSSLPISCTCRRLSAASGQRVSRPLFFYAYLLSLTHVVVWSYGSSSEWPQGGEVDIIEGANTAHHNLISAHTADGCFQDESLAGLFSGEQRNTQCFVGEHNIGCGYNPAEDNLSSYGDSFNAVGGGVYAMQWDNKHIRVWHFARGQIPVDIMAKKPQPEKWGLPEAVFGGKSCNVDDYFKDMNLVINIVSPLSSSLRERTT